MKVGLFVFIISLLVILPTLVIWALNILFALMIPYTMETWAATFILLAVIGGRSNK